MTMMKYPLLNTNTNTLSIRMARVGVGLFNSIAKNRNSTPPSISISSLSSLSSLYKPPITTATTISTANFSTTSSSSSSSRSRSRGLRRRRQTASSRSADANAKIGIGNRLTLAEQNEAAAARLVKQGQEMVKKNQDGGGSGMCSPVGSGGGNPSGSGSAAEGGGFVARDKDGKEVTMEEYLKFASLSPWVPCPDPVARRVFDIARAGPDDVHYELGSGDGRFNFQAIDVYNVKKSVGIDIDPSLIAQSNHRIAKRHPRPEHIKFHCADLLESESDSELESSDSGDDSDGDSDGDTLKLWNTMKEECTIVTMYFVSDALQKLKPKFEKYLVGKKGCKVITVGYEMKGWEAQWVEVCLGLTVHMYDMENLDSLYNNSSLFVGDDDSDSDIDIGIDIDADADADRDANAVANAEYKFLKDIEMDKQLNILSRQKLAKMQEEEDAKDGVRNPFGIDTSVAKKTVLEEEVYEDGHWDFDENEVYSDDDDV